MLICGSTEGAVEAMTSSLESPFLKIFIIKCYIFNIDKMLNHDFDIPKIFFNLRNF